MTMSDNDSTGNFASSLSARFRRKERVARGEQVPETREEELAQGAEVVAAEAVETEEDAALDDAALLEKYGVDNPEEIKDEAKLEDVLNGGFPDRIRQMALRRMWRLNPFFGVVDDMVEYGENYTDAATVIEGMTTAYQVGKGYLQQALDATEKVEDAVDKALPADGAREGDGGSEAKKAPADTDTDSGAVRGAEEGEVEGRGTEGDELETPTEPVSSGKQPMEEQETPGQVGQPEPLETDVDRSAAMLPEPGEEKRLRPSRMQFRKGG